MSDSNTSPRHGAHGGPREWEPGKRRHPASRARVIAGAVSVAGMAGITGVLVATHGGTTTVSSGATTGATAATTPTTLAPPVPSPTSPRFGGGRRFLTPPTTSAPSPTRPSARPAVPSDQPSTSSRGS